MPRNNSKANRERRKREAAERQAAYAGYSTDLKWKHINERRGHSSSEMAKLISAEPKPGG